MNLKFKTIYEIIFQTILGITAITISLPSWMVFIS